MVRFTVFSASSIHSFLFHGNSCCESTQPIDALSSPFYLHPSEYLGLQKYKKQIEKRYFRCPTIKKIKIEKGNLNPHRSQRRCRSTHTQQSSPCLNDWLQMLRRRTSLTFLCLCSTLLSATVEAEDELECRLIVDVAVGKGWP